MPVPNSGVPVSAPQRVDVLQVSEHEAILEPVQERLRLLSVNRNELRRDVVVRVADDLQVLGGKALEEPDHLVSRLEDVLDARFEREDRAAPLGDGHEPLECVVEPAPCRFGRIQRESVHSPSVLIVPVSVATT